MAMVLHHHPYTRAANVVWMLEEVGVPYELAFVDIMRGGQKAPELLAMNPMGKLPILRDGDAVVTESAAIALYLGDRAAAGVLAPALDDPARGAYLRWSLFAPSVIEPAMMAKRGGWTVDARSAGWGTFDDVVAAMDSAIAGREYLLGDRFSMADTVFGGTVGYMLDFKLFDGTPALRGYVARLAERPASRRAREKNQAIARDHGLGG